MVGNKSLQKQLLSNGAH